MILINNTNARLRRLKFAEIVGEAFYELARLAGNKDIKKVEYDSRTKNKVLYPLNLDITHVLSYYSRYPALKAALEDDNIINLSFDNLSAISMCLMDKNENYIVIDEISRRILNEVKAIKKASTVHDKEVTSRSNEYMIMLYLSPFLDTLMPLTEALIPSMR